MCKRSLSGGYGMREEKRTRGWLTTRGAAKAAAHTAEEASRRFLFHALTPVLAHAPLHTTENATRASTRVCPMCSEVVGTQCAGASPSVSVVCLSNEEP